MAHVSDVEKVESVIDRHLGPGEARRYRKNPDAYVFPLSSDDDDTVCAIRAKLPSGWAVGYTGDCNTDGDGYDTDDVSVWRKTR